MKQQAVELTIVFCALLVPFETRSATHYVDQASRNPRAPYPGWASAAVTIQDAVDCAEPGDEIVVGNGVYRTGGRLAEDSTTNRVVVLKPVLVRSLYGPAATVIVGYRSPAGENAPENVRCVYLGEGAALCGFTVTNGGTQFYSSAGGISCASTNAFITNCIITGNARGGVHKGALERCTSTGNTGGGAAWSTLNRCIITRNSGGGVGWGTLKNCVVSFNSSSGYGAGVAFGIQNNCTIVSNTSTSYGAGAYYAKLTNCIVYYNQGIYSHDVYNSLIEHCCTPALGWNAGSNFTNSPLFVDLAGGDLRLRPESPCINAGTNPKGTAGTDLEGNPRISAGRIDVGAYEFPWPASTISYAWLQQFQLPLDGSADSDDPDGDGMNNWQEWRCGTNPLDAVSVLRVISAIPAEGGMLVTWRSVPGRKYVLERSTNLAAKLVFYPVATNVVAESYATALRDYSAVGAGSFFYRVAADDN